MHLGMSLISAFGLGALHALEPGHGKGIMGTYLVLSRGRAIDAVILGLLPATTHTLVVVILAVTASSTTWLAAAAAGLPRQEFSIWLQFVLGLLVVIIGLRMLLSRSGSCCDHFCKHSTLQLAKLPGINRDTGGLLLVGISNGLVPCPGALAIMLLSIGSGTPATGLALVVAFGVGGAGPGDCRIAFCQAVIPDPAHAGEAQLALAYRGQRPVDYFYRDTHCLDGLGKEVANQLPGRRPFPGSDGARPPPNSSQALSRDNHFPTLHRGFATVSLVATTSLGRPARSGRISNRQREDSKRGAIRGTWAGSISISRWPPGMSNSRAWGINRR